MKQLFLTYLFLSYTIVGFAQEQPKTTDKPAYYIFSIYFGGGSYYIDGQQIQDFNDWLDKIPTVEGYEISVHSHTDNIGSLEYNAWLSQMRSEAAIDLLVQRGYDGSSISIEDFGELNPIYDNSTHEGRLKNRRADIIIKPVIQ